MTQLSSKGQILRDLQNRLRRFSVPESLLFSAEDWASDPTRLLERIQHQFGNKVLIVRSSAADEDGETTTLAGEYDSVLDVQCGDRDALQSAIAQVVASYARNGSSREHDEILVQEMVQGVILSGVVFTHELNTGAPYYVINYDDISGLTNTVTSGAGEYANRTLYIHRSATGELRSERFQQLIAALLELESVMGSQFLDVEFAVDRTLQPYLFQVRTITTQPNWNRGLARRIDTELCGIQGFVRRRFDRMHGVYGASSVLGQMPDWNPAEMIGRAPRALSMSLYRKLITDDAWRIAREEMGYAVPAGQPLMVSLAGQPFVDSRLSFHSYLPASLPDTISEKLVDTWVKRLRDHPELHDKIEFEVAITTFSFDIDDRLEDLAGTLSAAERACFRDALRSLTLPLLSDTGPGGITDAMARVQRLAALDMPPADGELAGLHNLIADCIRFGTVPFAILARHGFIARTLLLSLVKRGVLSADDMARMQASVQTVAGELLEHMHELQRGNLTRDEFMRRYGHLRPGTYDILSPRYDQMQDFGLAESRPAAPLASPARFELSELQREKLDSILGDEHLGGIDAKGILAYCAAAIAGREYGKFVFTRSVSAMLELIAAFGERHGLSREEMSHVPLDCLLEAALCSSGLSIEERLRTVAEEHAERHALTSAIRLPQVLFDEAGVHVVPFQVSQPNFITSRQVSAETVYLGVHHPVPALGGRIVLIENADPGYDWIFAHPIAGLVTKYGGANSHMAIRCAEFGIPAAIGCGEQRFDALLKVNRLSIDCSVGLITLLH